MKKLAIIAMLFCACTVTAQETSNYYLNTEHSPNSSIFSISATVYAIDNHDDLLHGVANAFADYVGKELKKLAPVTIVPGSLTVELKVEDHGMMSLRYTVELQKTSSGDELYYFDHRGALSVSTSRDEARNDSQRRCLNQFNSSIVKFRAKYGTKNQQTLLPYNYGTIKNGDYYWSISESFFASGM
jgi:hypothetical protein